MFIGNDCLQTKHSKNDSVTNDTLSLTPLEYDMLYIYIT